MERTSRYRSGEPCCSFRDALSSAALISTGTPGGRSGRICEKCRFDSAIHKICVKTLQVREILMRRREFRVMQVREK